MRRHELLRQLHALLSPRTYFEIGVSNGASLTLSLTRSPGDDPYYAVKRGVRRGGPSFGEVPRLVGR